MRRLLREVCSQLIEKKALSWGIIRKSACILTEITIRKSQAETLGVLKTKRINGEITQDQYLAASDQLRSYISGNSIRIVDVNIANSEVFMEAEELVRRYSKGEDSKRSRKQSIDISDAFQIVTVKLDYFSQFPETQPIVIRACRETSGVSRS